MHSNSTDIPTEISDEQPSAFAESDYLEQVLPRWPEDDRRRHARIEFRRQVTLRIPNDPLLETDADSQECQVWASTLAAGGISFVYPVRIEHKELQVALDLLDGTAIWFHAEILHSRELDDGSGWEYGATFRGLADC